MCLLHTVSFEPYHCSTAEGVAQYKSGSEGPVWKSFTTNFKDSFQHYTSSSSDILVQVFILQKQF
jgi:hypothetical protein